MNSYNPSFAPIAEDWLALDESERAELVAHFHRDIHRVPDSLQAHAHFHVIVENQLLDPDCEDVRRTLKRLIRGGVSRHAAIHAIGSVVASSFYRIVKGDGNVPFDRAGYSAELAKLKAKVWR